jgi:hypothetical protein
LTTLSAANTLLYKSVLSFSPEEQGVKSKVWRWRLQLGADSVLEMSGTVKPQNGATYHG